MAENLYTPNLMGMDSQAARVIRDLADRVNYLTTELDRVRGMTMLSSPGVDAAKRENPQPGIITIPYRDGGGEDGFIRVSPDGIITSYTNPVESIFPYTDITTIGNVGAGLDSLHSFSLPANSLAFDGDAVWFRYVGNLATNDNDKRLRVSIDNQTLEDTGLIDIDTGWWLVEGTYTRTSPTTVFAEAHIVFGFLSQLNGAAAQAGSSQRHIARNAPLTVAHLNTNPVILLVQAEATANNDVTQNLSNIQLSKPRTVKLV
jgi:hypothetical protein